MTTDRPIASAFATELRRRRLERKLTLAEFSRRVHYSKGHVSKVENGLKAPGIDFARRADAELEADGVLTALVRSEDRSTNSVFADMALDIAHIRHGPGSVRFETHLAFAGHSFPSPSGVQAIEYYRAVLARVKDLGQTLGPTIIMPILRTQVGLLLGDAQSSPSENSDQFLHLAARFMEFAGWMAQEMGDNEAAIRWTESAVAVAQQVGDDDMIAYAYVRKALIALYYGDHYGTIAMARRAQQMNCSTHVRRLAAQREAQGYALAGERHMYLDAIERAEQLLRGEDETNEPEYLGSRKVKDFDLARGWALYDLGQHQQAIEVLQPLHDNTEASSVRARTRIGARLALALASERQLDRTQDVLSTVLVTLPHIESATIRSDLTQLLKILRRWHADEAVQRMMPALSAALMPTAAANAGFDPRPGNAGT